MVEHLNIKLKSARGILVNVGDLGYNSAGNQVESCALWFPLTTDDVHRSMVDSACRPLDWFDGQL